MGEKGLGMESVIWGWEWCGRERCRDFGMARMRMGNGFGLEIFRASIALLFGIHYIRTHSPGIQCPAHYTRIHNLSIQPPCLSPSAPKLSHLKPRSWNTPPHPTVFSIHIYHKAPVARNQLSGFMTILSLRRGWILGARWGKEREMREWCVSF